MRIEEYIRNELRRRLEKSPSLVIYDGEKRYRALALGLADETTAVVDASEGAIESREAALDAWLKLPEEPNRRLVVYLPADPPAGDRERIEDPFLIFAPDKAYFPFDISDEYRSLCRAAFPDQSDEIERLFAQGSPSFDEVNALEAGSTWPKLSTLLRAESAAEITGALLTCASEKAERLESDKSAFDEARRFLKTQLGFDLPSGVSTTGALRAALWRFSLFSEFAFDLPIALPAELDTVPRAPASRRELILRVCARLRSNNDVVPDYVERASSIEDELNLPSLFRGEASLGEIEIFPFENARAFARFSRAFQEGDVGESKEIIGAHPDSLWRTGASRHMEVWRLAELAHEVAFTAQDDIAPRLRELSRPSVGELCGLFETMLSRLEGGFRRFHQALERVGAVEFFGLPLQPIVERVNLIYREFSERIHQHFLDAVEREGWPAPGSLRHSEVFAQRVRPYIEGSERVAYMMVDALRFDLAVELQRSLASENHVTLEAVAAQLPTKTEVGMAALLPDAAKLEISADEGDLRVRIAVSDVSGAARRDAFFKERYGDRIWVVQLTELTTLPQKHKVADRVKLAVVRTNAIDSAGEKDAGLLTTAVPTLLIQLERAIRRLIQLGFDRVVVATDHGFYYFPDRAPGDACTPPAGDWKVTQDRFLLGRGSEGTSTLSFAPRAIGIPTSEETICFPRGLTTFQAGTRYFHGGLSLPECVLPLISITPIAKRARKKSSAHVSILFKGKNSGKVFSRVFMVDLSCPQTEATLFDELESPRPLEIELSITDASGKTTVGTVAECQRLNPTTGRVAIVPGNSFRVPIRVNEDYRGVIIVRAIDGTTGIQHSTVTLETDFME